MVGEYFELTRPLKGYFDLARNRLRGTIPTELGIIKQLSRLPSICLALQEQANSNSTVTEQVRLFENQLTGTIPSEMEFMTDLGKFIEYGMIGLF